MIAQPIRLRSDYCGLSMKNAVFEYLRTIPAGKVVTYSQVAAAVGHPGACRAVGNILHTNPDPDTYPCFRVVNAKGMTAEHFGFGGREEQVRRLRADGIEVTGGRVDLNKYQWNP